MVPGMGHCQGGDGTDTFDKLSVYPQTAQYTGLGNTDDATNFAQEPEK